MKILQLRFKNLNSLVGEWTIDFTDPAYVNEGIFAITGPTGAGKSTILDALSLALYGRTPRLKEISASQNEIMSRRTGECFAEVLFESLSGRFQCHWAQHRAYKKAHGNLAQSTHEISDATGHLIENKKRKVIQVVEEKSGMDFDRFTRSMLLAQGGFAAFLQAKSADRAPILEQITGTEIYSDISKLVHERLRREKDLLALKEAACEGIVILTDEEEKAFSVTLKEKEVAEKEISQKLQTVIDTIDRSNKIKALETELGSLQKEKEQIENELTLFKPSRTRLNRALQAANLDAAYALLSSHQNQQANDLKTLKTHQSQIPEKEAEATRADTALSESEKQLELERERQQKEMDLIQKVRLLDADIAEKQNRLLEISSEVKDMETAIHALTREKEALHQQEKRNNEEMATVNAYRESHKTDAGLIESFTAIESEVKAFQKTVAARGKRGDALTENERALKKIAANLDKKQRLFSHNKKALEAASHHLKQLTGDLDSLLEQQSPSALRKTHETLLEKLNKIHALSQSLTDIKTNLKEYFNAKEKRTEFEHQLVEIDSKNQALKQRQESEETRAEHLEKELSLRRRIESLEEERKKLQDNHPCPLCGSPHHPYAQGNIPQSDETACRLSEIKAQLKATAKEMTGLTRRKTELEKDLAHTNETIEHLETAINTNQAFFISNCTALDSPKTKQSEKIEKDITNPEGTGATALDSIFNAQADTGINTGLLKALTERTKHLEGTTKEKAATLKKRIEKADQLGLDIQKATAQEKKAQDAFNKAEKTIEKYQFKHNETTRTLKSVQEDLKQLDDECLELEQAILTRTTNYGIHAIEVDPVKKRNIDIQSQQVNDLQQMVKELKKRRDKWQANEKKKTTIEMLATDLSVKRNGLETELTSKNKELLKQSTRFTQVTKRQTALQTERQTVYGIKDPDEEQKKMDRLRRQKEGAVKKRREGRDLAREALQTLNHSIRSLSDKIEARKETLASSRAELNNGLTKYQFNDEADYLASCLPLEERERLETAGQSLDHKMAENKARFNETQRKLHQEKNSTPIPDSMETLQTTRTELQSTQKTLDQEMGAIKQKLKDNDTARTTFQRQRRALEGQQKECLRWNTLHALIGSADGKKFRNFAQGLTFEVMLSHANRQLSRMSDRYLLIQNDSDPLELDVVDNYQGGETRSTKNLSGGESFIVSLSLALGLSSMAGKNVRVDSLFLDEGFGTLDDDALETALSALAGLHREGKLIGVISHVTALKDRIATQINVTPFSGGRSRLSGPGCRTLQ